MPEPTRVCADCNQRKPWSDFWPKAKWPDGSTRQPHCYCKPCHQERTNEWEREKRASDPEWGRERARRARAIIKADPDRYAAHLSYQREWARKRYGYRRDLRKRVDAKRVFLPVVPFADWLGTLGDTKEEIARRVGMDPRMVYTILKGEYATVEVDTVDRALLAVGDGTTIDSLYPNVSLEAA